MMRNRQLGVLLLLYLRRRRIARRRRAMQVDRRWWQCPIIQRRTQFGAWDNLVQELRNFEPEKFLNYHRITVLQFDQLLAKVVPLISRQDVVREPIQAGLKLSLTLRYLASGESMVSLAYSYRVGRSTTSSIIAETCQAVWDVLNADVLKPPTRDDWERIAQDFETLWNFPNCVGAIDGKHVVVQCFRNTGSQFYNYKGSFSIVLMACCDAQYRFTLFSIGSAGRECDGGIFQSSNFGQAILRNRLPLPQSRCLPGSSVPLPAVFVGDAAFPLMMNMMRPYVGRDLPPGPTIFNYRLSRARRVVENAFGVLANRFRIYRRPIIARQSTVRKVVLATVALHNWLRNVEVHAAPARQNYIPPGYLDYEDRDGIVNPGQWREEVAPQGIIPMQPNAARNSTNEAKVIRDSLRDYFMADGAVPWQWNKLPEHEREVYVRRQLNP